MLGARVTVCEHWPFWEAVAAAWSAYEPEWTGVLTTLPPVWQVHGPRLPVSRPPFTTAPGGVTPVTVSV